MLETSIHANRPQMRNSIFLVPVRTSNGKVVLKFETYAKHSELEKWLVSENNVIWRKINNRFTGDR